MSKRDNDPSEFERVAHAGWMVALRYRMLLQTVQPARRPAKWPWVTSGIGAAAIAVTGAMNKLGWF